jgi:hypothetical protein
LERDAASLASQLSRKCQVVLLGSIATTKYREVLGKVLGDHLHFPVDFQGRGDMSRGALMLRCVRAGQELNYAPLANELPARRATSAKGRITNRPGKAAL